MPTQLFVPKFRVEECLNQVRECLDMGWTGLGFKTVEIEEKWRAYTGLPNAHFLASNTVGLHLAFEILKRRHGWNESHEVITTPLTFVSTNHAILYAGLKPVFADTDEFLCLDPDSVKSRITPQTKALIFVGMGGNTGRFDEIVEICRANDIKVILDAAHMAGTRINGQHVGHNADVTVFSFQAVKNLPTADSGMICFNDQSDDEHARKLSWLGINKDTYARSNSKGAYKWQYEVEELGYKYHGNSIMAGLAIVGLKYLDHDNSYRRQLVNWYREELSNLECIQIVESAPGCESSSHLFQILTSNRDELLMALNEHDIFPGVHYRDNTNYTIYSSAAGTCPNAALQSERLISLPMHLGISREDVSHVAALVRKYAR